MTREKASGESACPAFIRWALLIVMVPDPVELACSMIWAASNRGSSGVWCLTGMFIHVPYIYLPIFILFYLALKIRPVNLYCYTVFKFELDTCTVFKESRKTRRKATRRKVSGGKLVARTKNNFRQI